MINWCVKPDLIITSDIEPCCGVSTPLPDDTEEARKIKQTKPFINKRRVVWHIRSHGRIYKVEIERGFRWDGATIPRVFWRVTGSNSSPAFLTASCVHDVLCEKHYLIDGDRRLASIVFREILLASGVGKFRAYAMYYAVELYQKHFRNWGKK